MTYFLSIFYIHRSMNAMGRVRNMSLTLHLKEDIYLLVYVCRHWFYVRQTVCHSYNNIIRGWKHIIYVLICYLVTVLYMYMHRYIFVPSSILLVLSVSVEQLVQFVLKNKFDPVVWPTIFNIHTYISLFKIGNMNNSRQSLFMCVHKRDIAWPRASSDRQ